MRTEKGALGSTTAALSRGAISQQRAEALAIGLGSSQVGKFDAKLRLEGQKFAPENGQQLPATTITTCRLLQDCTADAAQPPCIALSLTSFGSPQLGGAHL
jgi:hypothetical protein